MTRPKTDADLEDIARMLVGFEDRQTGSGAASSRARLANALKSSPSARANHGRLRMMLDRAVDAEGAEKEKRAMALYETNKKGGYDVAAWIDEGRLPNGRRDPDYEVRAVSSRKNFYSTLVMVADPAKACAAFATGVPDAARDFFRARLKALSEEVRTAVRKNELTDRESRSILPWETVMAKYKENRDNLKDEDRLIVDFWLVDPMEFPPKRLDVGNCLIVSGAAGARAVPATQDYLLVRRRQGFSELHLRNYKTSKHYGEFVQALPPALTAAIIADLDADAELRQPEAKAKQANAKAKARAPWRRHLFQSRQGRGGPVADNTFGRQVATAFERLTGVPIGASNLRKSFVSFLLNIPDISQERLGIIAHKMQHSEDIQRLYRRVDIAEKTAGTQSENSE